MHADAPPHTTSPDEVPAATAPPASLEHRFRTGQPGALEDVIATHQPTLTRLVYRLTGWSAPDVDDIVQETFVSALRAARSFDARSSLSTWLTRIAINQCRSTRRKRLLHLRHWTHLVFHHDTATPSDQSTHLDSADRAARVTQAVRRLPAKYREVVVLRYLQEMDIEDIARTLTLSRPAVEVRLHRARQLLKESLADVWKD